MRYFRDYHASNGSTYPVYIPDGGLCKAFEKLSKEKYEYELDSAFKCECCKKELLGKIAAAKLIFKGFLFYDN